MHLELNLIYLIYKFTTCVCACVCLTQQFRVLIRRQNRPGQCRVRVLIRRQNRQHRGCMLPGLLLLLFFLLFRLVSRREKEESKKESRDRW
jgi:hypothetical protein